MSQNAQTIDHTGELAAINSKVIADGETLPAVKLRDGSTVQTGTVAAMLVNIAAYNQGERGEVERQLQLAIPTLIKVGLFQLFPAEEWIRGDNPGRTLLGEMTERYLADQASNT
ncbi:DUF7709 family protein [Chromobacterium sphagni]|uniref:DUF7709 domain-containing protein n=1 Tax=Chromobacterium sphagni TaxID=1903179 RepID=A0A1S1X0H9_9NEIS|nr:hypothetical protein [Chromobacterium sphagni]OHX13032.1 hypothetical protein BI347_05520 [Chromobacterium sphagni]OHX19302.1 hypothetical protein BI344_09260 [Chromobacterium sphagni]